MAGIGAQFRPGPWLASRLGRQKVAEQTVSLPSEIIARLRALYPLN